MPKDEIELEDRETGKTVSVPIAHYRRWKASIDVHFRPVAEKKIASATPAAPPTESQTREVDSN